MPAHELTVVSVCGAERCAGTADLVVDALGPVVRDSPGALLLRTSGCPLRGACRHHRGSRIVVQRCIDSMQAVGSPAHLVTDDADACARLVTVWLRAYRVLRPLR